MSRGERKTEKGEKGKRGRIESVCAGEKGKRKELARRTSGGDEP